MKHNKRMSYLEYSLLANVFLCAQKINAQVNYIDIEPDLIIFDAGSDFIDFDNNFIDDFKFNIGNLAFSNTSDIICYSSVYALILRCNDSNSIVGTSNAYDPPVAITINVGEQINVYNNFIDDAWLYLTFKQRVVDCFSYIPEGDWHYFDLAGWHESATEDKFIGVRFDSGIEGCLYYGWIRCVFNESMDTLTVKDYAYNSVCNEGLFAGSLISSVQQLQAFEFNALVQQNQLFLTIPIKVLGARLTIHNSVGQDVFSKSINSETEVFDISTLAGGIYCAVLTFDGKQSGKLIYKK